ncbi:MAG: acyl-CoA thioesterase [Myxococcales bacterium]|jgi:1,4-dihydroxy-2-naphthoyl-CoA hydrolase
MAFEHRLRVRFHDTDPAGIVFFANIFVYCHDAFEEMLRAVGLPLDELIRSREQILPLGHAEADFKKPFRHGKLVDVRIVVGKLSDRSMRLDYELRDDAGDLLATCSTVHVAVDPATGRSTALSPRLREALEPHRA